jgi:hypothetical protein
VEDITIEKDTSSAPLPFSIGDVDAPVDTLVVTASSSDQAVIPDANLVLGGTGADRTVTVTPAADASGGPVTITLTVSDGQISTTETFNVTVFAPAQSPPTISAVEDVVIDEDTSTAPLPFTIGDIDTPIDDLTVTASSSDQALIPDGNLVLGGTSANRTVTVTPAANAFGGPATITLTVSDGVNSTTETFDVTVDPVNDAPTISSIGEQTVRSGASTAPIPFTVADVDNDAATLSVTATSDNEGLIPVERIVVEGSGTNRTVNITPLSGTVGGTVQVTLTVDDGDESASGTFTVIVTPAVIGDSNNDGFFNTADLVLVLQSGEYEDTIPGNSTWEEGDWNRDGDFGTGDFVYALQEGTYESAVPAKPVVEQTSESNAEISPSLADIALAVDDLFDSDDWLIKRIVRSK